MKLLNRITNLFLSSELAKKTVRRANFELAAVTFIKMFQRCELGHFTLDADRISVGASSPAAGG